MSSELETREEDFEMLYGREVVSQEIEAPCKTSTLVPGGFFLSSHASQVELSFSTPRNDNMLVDLSAQSERRLVHKLSAKIKEIRQDWQHPRKLMIAFKSDLSLDEEGVAVEVMFRVYNALVAAWYAAGMRAKSQLIIVVNTPFASSIIERLEHQLGNTQVSTFFLVRAGEREMKKAEIRQSNDFLRFHARISPRLEERGTSVTTLFPPPNETKCTFDKPLKLLELKIATPSELSPSDSGLNPKTQ